MTKESSRTENESGIANPYTKACRIANPPRRELFNSDGFKRNHMAILKNKQSNEGVFSVDMTGEVFHIGHTNVEYTKKNGENTTTITYSAFTKDGFWDPAFLSEKTLGKWGVFGDMYKPDGKGGHLEMGGSPYDYIPRVRTYFCKPEE